MHLPRDKQFASTPVQKSFLRASGAAGMRVMPPQIRRVAPFGFAMNDVRASTGYPSMLRNPGNLQLIAPPMAGDG
jgi:hypothetical protein